MIPILFVLIFIIVWIAYQRSKSDRAIKKETDAFWSRERQANLTRKKDLSKLNYITVPFENLPFSETANEEIQYVQEQIWQLRDQKIVNLAGQSNTDLKLTYGAANMDSLSSYDNNFTLLIRSLNKWGQLLYQENNLEAARTVLEYAVSCKSDISHTYLTLATIYYDSKNIQQLKQLSQEASCIDTPLKDSLQQKLHAICEKAFHEQE